MPEERGDLMKAFNTTGTSPRQDLQGNSNRPGDPADDPRQADQGAEGAEAARVPKSMLADEAASNAAAGPAAGGQ